MSGGVNQASGVTVASPETLGGEPPKRGGRALAKRQRGVAYGLLAPGTVFLFLAFLVPLALIVYTSLQSGGLLSGGFSFTWEFANYSSALSDYGGFYWKSLGISATATVFCILAAYPMAYWIAFYGGKWKSTLFFLILVPFFVSFVIRTVQWKFLLADDGVLFGPLKSIGLLPEDFRVLAGPVAVVAGITYNFLPFMALPLYVSLEKIDRRLIEAATDLYASRTTAFRKVTLRLALPGIFAGSLLTFIPACGDFINAALLGTPQQYMIGNVIQSKFLNILDYPQAAALSFTLMLFILVGIFLYARVLGARNLTQAAV